jgi:putative oxidoreductase
MARENCSASSVAWTGPERWRSFLRNTGFAGVIEFFGGVLVAIGLFTGYAAFIVSGEMAIAYFQNHFPKGFWPILNTGERAVFYCFTFLFISSRGAVRWGLDNFFSSRGKR